MRWTAASRAWGDRQSACTGKGTSKSAIVGPFMAVHVAGGAALTKGSRTTRSRNVPGPSAVTAPAASDAATAVRPDARRVRPVQQAAADAGGRDTAPGARRGPFSQ